MPARFKAFLLHLVGSALIALLTLGLVFRLWYPAPLQDAVGVTEIYLLLLLVDVVVGPLLTLLVFKVGKKTLVLDMTAILLLQCAALGYGLWTVAEGRPAWLVFNSGRFDLVQALEIDERKLDEAADSYRHPSWLGPRWVGAVTPEGLVGRPDLRMADFLKNGTTFTQRPQLYRPLEEMADAMRQGMQPLASLNRFNPDERVSATLAGWPDADGWLPLMAQAQPKVVLMRKDTASVVAIVDLNPWVMESANLNEFSR